MDTLIRKYRIALVTFSFTPDKPGGTSAILIKILRILSANFNAETSIYVFANYRASRESLKRIKTRRFGVEIFHASNFEDSKVFEILPLASKFEFMRYRKNSALKNHLETYDLIIIVTGFLQFANVIPKLKTRVLVQCATRLKWERKSQYPAFSLLKRWVLKIQIPLFQFQEWRVLRSNVQFLPENSKMYDWIKARSRLIPEKWYPPFASSTSDHLSECSQSGHFVSVGRFEDSRKGWERLFDAYVMAFNVNSELPKLIVIGWGEFPKPLQEKIISLQLVYPIEVLPNLPNDERDHYLSSASYFLQASFEEGLGLAALEALSFGTPIICSETDGSREYVFEGISGFLVPQGENFASRFSKKIIDCHLYADPRMRESSKALFNNTFSERISTRRFVEIVTKTLA
jgi:glycosyltransferase involved in cell wall biosynthesis